MNNNNNDNKTGSALIDAAIEILSTTRTNTVERLYQGSPAFIIIDRVDWEKWFLDEQTRTFCTFYNKTGGNARTKNVKFIEKFGPHAQPHVALPSTINTNEGEEDSVLPRAGIKRGRKSTINFNEVFLYFYHF